MSEIKALRASEEKLLEALKMYSRLFFAIDGLWFLIVEEEYGYEASLKVDVKVWERYGRIEAKRIMRFFGIVESGIPAIIKVIRLSPVWLGLEWELSEITDDRAVVRVTRCPALEAMEKAGRTRFVCEPVDTAYISGLAKAVEPRALVQCLKVPPRESPQDTCCEWEFRIE